MELIPKTKYTPFRSDSFSSTDETASNPSLPSSAPLTPLTPPGIPPSLSSSSLTPILPPSSPRQAENSPTTLCSFFPRMGALRLGVSSTLLPGLKASSRPASVPGGQGGLGESPEDTGTSAANSSPLPPPLPLLSLTAPSPPPRPPQDMNRLGGASRRARVEGGQLGGDEWTRHGSFVNKPTRGWLHSDNVVSTSGVSYTVRPSSRCLSSILGKSNLQFAGMTISLTVSTSSLNLLAIDCKQIIANHHMQSISFASGGDPDTAEYVAYVAKDPVNQRACHILECSEGLAQEVISTIGQAFELRFKQYLKNPPKLVTPHDRMAPFDGSAWEEEEEDLPPPPDVPYYNNFPGKQPPPGGLVDMRTRPGHSTGATLPYGQPSQNDIHKQPLPPLPVGVKEGGLFDDPSYVNVDKPRLPTAAASNGNAHRDAFDMKPFDAALGVSGAVAPPLAEQLQNEPWFHGPLSRRQAERLLTKDGDFLVRESGTTPGQYVLTGQQGGQPKHLLLVDPEGVVRTKDHRFESVSHLISYHMDNRLPIISAGSETKKNTAEKIIDCKNDTSLAKLSTGGHWVRVSHNTQESVRSKVSCEETLRSKEKVETHNAQRQTRTRPGLLQFLPSGIARALQSTVERWSEMHPQRPMPQAMPSSLGQNLRDAALRMGHGKNLLGGNVAYGVIQSLKECLYFLLCCWCIKEILD
ncbi:SHC-transforming 1 isoform X1 [Labeo rohita]|uniref:SHC-transforming protein 1 n=1 Tax=Labeo rohita TaxID=84645 RepID=A0A498LBA5_LABRO|nr:SHC-transforming 1 isoform X1 [Labeo rohita]RXN10309.1 SHC-transforming 1 isoform X1 [Labeo rohita]